ncbi:hypothetical protein [Petrachloros mirabilis]
MHRLRDSRNSIIIAVSFFLAPFVISPFSNGAIAGTDIVPPGLNRALEVQKAHSKSLLKQAGVVGTAVGFGPDGFPVVQVYTERAGLVPLPKFIDGVMVQEIAAGKFHALEACDRLGLPIPLCQPGIEKRPSGGGGSTTSTTVDPTAYFSNPVPIGVSTGNRSDGCMAGTIGARLNNSYALSNNHVFARENLGVGGDDILQPGLYDTNCIDAANNSNQIGDLLQFKAINFSGANTVDAAIADFGTTNRELGCATPSNGYGAPDPLAGGTTLSVDNLLMTPVQKYGRTTSLTKGTIVSINWEGNVGYSTGTASFVDQIVVYSSRGAFVKAGDSGSLVVGQPGPGNAKKPSGLLFAGDSSGRYGIVNRIDNVLSSFGDAYSIDGGPSCTQ